MTQSNVDPFLAVIENNLKVFEGHLEPVDKTMDKKLIIAAATSGGLVDRRYNPHIAVTADEVAKETEAAWKAGASIWHFDPRNPENGLTFMPLDKRLKYHKEWCDAVFKVAPDVITLVGVTSVRPITLTGGLVDQKSFQAETRVAPLIEELIKMGPDNRYVEMASTMFLGGATGGTRSLAFANKESVISDVKYFQSKGIKIELGTFGLANIHEAKNWVIDTGIVKPPVMISTASGIHNSPMPESDLEAFTFLLTLTQAMRRLPKGVLWMQMVGGRYWMPMAVASIIMGADIIRVGMEDSIYMYPHKNDLMETNGKAVEAVAQIAKYLGREVATPGEARKILDLPQIPAKK
jgi:3-keto-5-aminohexanoate cleavage enzyme